MYYTTYKRIFAFLLCVSLSFNIFLSAAVAEEARGFSNFVSADWYVENKDKKDLVLVDAREEKEFNQGHLHNAVNFPSTKTYALDPPKYKLVKMHTIINYIRELGIDNTKTVLVYDSGNIKYAARVAWTLHIYGLNKVGILDGGLKALELQGVKLTTDMTKVDKSEFVAVLRGERIASKLDVRLKMNKSQSKIIDVRSEDQFAGKISKAGRSGHIPSAVNIPWKENFYINKDGVMLLKPKKELQKLYSIVTKDQEVVLYCNRGRTSSASFMIMEDLGYNIASYDGAWMDWGNDYTMPVEK